MHDVIFELDCKQVVNAIGSYEIMNFKFGFRNVNPSIEFVHRQTNQVVHSLIRVSLFYVSPHNFKLFLFVSLILL